MNGLRINSMRFPARRFRLNRSAEAAWWIFAVVSFAPVSQIFPFVNPAADGYPPML